MIVCLNSCSFVKIGIPMMRNRYSVLLVDDDTIYQFTARKTLEATGFTDKIWICSNGEEAIKLLERNLADGRLPDVIFLDVNMPVMNGWDFLEQYSSIKSSNDLKPPVFIVSSSVDEADIIHSRQFQEVTDYIIKPILREKFTEILSTLSVA